MRILVIVQGDYGKRIVEHLRRQGPAEWSIETYALPLALPAMIDDPDDVLPDSMPQADLLLSLGERPGAADLLPDIVRRTGARAVIAPVSHREWVPMGLMNQVRRKLEARGIACAFPVPFCALTPEDSHHELVQEFTRHFGRPAMSIRCEEGRLAEVTVERGAACGCTRFVAEGLVGAAVEEAEEKAGLLHHHYPCLASMGMDAEFEDTLMHRSGLMVKIAVAQAVAPHKKERTTYVVPR